MATTFARLCRDLGNTQVTGDVSTWSAMTQATNMCAASILSLCLASARRPCVDDVQGAYITFLATVFAET